MKKAFFQLLILIIFSFISVSRISAAGEFNADYDVSYAVSPAGNTIVTQNITLTNRLTNLYPRQYLITIDSDNIKNIVAYDQKGMITPIITQNNGKTEIQLTFNEQVVGLGKKLNFSLRFESGDIAQKHGNIWEVNVPGIVDDPDLGSYSVSLDTPPSFGPSAYLWPLPSSGRRWSKQQMIAGGISAAFGTSQIFLLDLKYFLENSKITPQQTEVALPPDTAFQRVSINEIKPRPETVVKDKDGNWLARYILAPSQKIEVAAKIAVSVNIKPRDDFFLDNENLDEYLKSDRYWETTSPEIVSLAQQYRTPRQIYELVVKTLEYDYGRVEQNPLRKGALAVLSNPKNSVCMEFTDLFIAIARAAGIPAREMVGYAYTTNSKLRPLSLVADVLHSWPEYYDRDKKLWVPVDPTWAKTTGGVNYFDKLDFNHVVFAIHGISSEYPYPAGFYRQSGKSGKDIQVVFGDAAPESLPAKLTTTFNFPKTVTAGFPAKGSLIVENTSSLAISDASILVQASPFVFSLNRYEASIPPFSKITLPIIFETKNYLKRVNGRLTATVNGESVNHYFEVRPFYWIIIPLGIGFMLPLLGLVIFYARPKLWHYLKRH